VKTTRLNSSSQSFVESLPMNSAKGTFRVIFLRFIYEILQRNDCAGSYLLSYKERSMKSKRHECTDVGVESKKIYKRNRMVIC